ncbi:MAG: cupin domain-containing protein [Frankia sp.]|nr:cupin domain-containing protein [Frankia sp.]
MGDQDDAGTAAGRARFRRVVTGHDERGRAVFLADGLVEPVTARLVETVFHPLWRGDAAPVFPAGQHDGPNTSFFPPPGGFRFFVFELPPGGSPPPPQDDAELAAAVQEMDEKLPGLREVFTDPEPGMHRTDTLDLQVVLSGEVTLELDDGARTVLRAGDVNIQNGTRHRWSNQSAETAVVLCVVLGASRAPAAGEGG